ncbi:nucleobindin-2 isoform X2 [Hylaeus volcanicus]|uniref:nucleobindin-2 isoform X2 n=1 Tax=Hylaeus volcanicus TaxID=313075 RepID=UPI0023B842F8|nr:nucleobindin-2 isoform X2 [Hylaeus volcanicus]
MLETFSRISAFSINMKYFLLLVSIIITVQLSVAPPVNQKTKDGEHDGNNEVEEVEEMADIMEYRRYLMEVVQVLESDPDFRAKLEKVDDADIRTGKIADQLQFLNHNVRSKLDEIKRKELERLRHLATKENDIKYGLDTEHLKIPEHLDYVNTRSFEVQDLRKLIAKTTKDLAEADRKRREEFKQHEMEKKFEEQEKLKHMNEIEKKKYEEELEALREKQKKHDPIHHPGSKQQLEEVWEKQDHMDSEDFNPRTFFFLHDIDGNQMWDQDEVKTLFLKELDKLYAQGASEEVLFKRAEELERMREHVFNEADLNKDGLISYEEFLEQTKRPDFQQDQGWQPLDEQQIYTQEEFDAYERYKQEEMQRRIAQGMLQPHPGNIPAEHDPFPPQYASPHPQDFANPRGPNQDLPHQQQFHDQNHPQYLQHPQVVSQQQYPNHVPVQSVQGHIAQPQGQVPVQQHGQIPVQQQGQVPVQQHGQISVQQQGQIPVQQDQVPQSVQNNAVPQPNNPSHSNSQHANVPVQQNVNMNNIQTGGKV